MISLNEKNFIQFDKIYLLIQKAKKLGLISQSSYDLFNSIGLDQMEYKFFVPKLEDYKNIVQKYFEIEKIVFTDDIGAEIILFLF